MRSSIKSMVLAVGLLVGLSQVAGAENPLLGGSSAVVGLADSDLAKVKGSGATSALYNFYGSYYLSYASLYGAYGAYYNYVGSTSNAETYNYNAYLYAGYASSYYYYAFYYGAS